jgi:hypothetical protein
MARGWLFERGWELAIPMNIRAVDGKSLDGYLNVEINRTSLAALPSVLQHLADFEAPILLLADKGDLCFEELQPLVEVLDCLTSKNKTFLLAGLPHCVLQHVFGGKTFNKYRASMLCHLVGVPSLDSWVTNGSVIIPSCRNCIASRDCIGLGQREANWSGWGFRLNSGARVALMQDPGFENAVTRFHYEKFLAHISTCSQYYVDRTLRYASVFPVSGMPSYRERFTYFCRYLVPEEVGNELAFVTQVARTSSQSL